MSGFVIDPATPIGALIDTAARRENIWPSALLGRLSSAAYNLEAPATTWVHTHTLRLAESALRLHDYWWWWFTDVSEPHRETLYRDALRPGHPSPYGPLAANVRSKS